MSNTDTNARTAGQWPRPSTRPSPECPRMPQDRLTHPDRPRAIRFIKLVLMGLLTMREAALAFEVSNATLDRWRRDLLCDKQEDTDDLRKLRKAKMFYKDSM